MAVVLVTRPKLRAARLTDRLQQAGHKVIGEPLLDILPLSMPRPCLDQKPLIVLTSSTTLSILEARRAEVTDLLALRCYCVGDETAAQALTYGFADVVSANGNGEDLANLILSGEASASALPILHIGGREVSPQPALTLQNYGCRVIHWPIYETRAVAHFSPFCRDSLARREIDVAVFASVRTAQVFVKHIQDEELEPCCAGLTAVGLSEAVTQALIPLSLARVIVAPVPSEEGLWAVFSSLPL